MGNDPEGSYDLSDFQIKCSLQIHDPGKSHDKNCPRIYDPGESHSKKLTWINDPK